MALKELPSLVAEVRYINPKETFLPDNLIFGGRFAEVLKDMSDEFERHFPEKRDTWRTMHMGDLTVRLIRAYDQWTLGFGKDSSQQERDQLIDIANLCLMKATRLNKKV